MARTARSLTHLLCVPYFDCLPPQLPVLRFAANWTSGHHGLRPSIPSGVSELWWALNEDAQGLDDFLHADAVVETSECFSDEAIVACIRAADSSESDNSDDVVEQSTQVFFLLNPLITIQL